MKTLTASTRGRGGRGGGGGGRGGGRGGRGGRGGDAGRGRGGRGGSNAEDAGHQVAGKSRDPRFARRTADPRFSKIAVPERENKQARSDARFAKDPRFKRATVDARGRPVQIDELPDEDLDDDEEDIEEEEEEDMMSDASDDDVSGIDGDDEEDGEDVEEGYEEGSESDELDDASDVADFDDGDVEEIDATSRLAVVNCDWDHVRAVDIFAIFFHTLPLGGRLKGVKVYLSDFGKEQMERERTVGPDLWVRPADPKATEKVQMENAATMDVLQKEAESIELAKTVKKGAPSSKKGAAPAAPAAAAGDEEDAVAGEDSDIDDPRMFAEVGDEGEIFSGGKFRQYELNRMKYYYAVATFDSPDTAAAVYQACDGMDIEASGVVLDLRYVPEEETFDESRVSSSANRIPPNFKPLKSFKAAALSQTRFKISWDQDEPHRKQAMKDAFAEETEEANMLAYMASDSSGSEDEVGDAEGKRIKQERREKQRQSLRERYASLLDEVGGAVDELPPDATDAPAESKEADEEDSDDDGGMVGAGDFGTDDDDDASDDMFDVEDDDDDDDGDDEDEEEGEEEEDDDDLNQFDDVEFGQEDPFDVEDDEEDDSDADGEVTGNVVGKFDMNAGDRARDLENQLRRAKQMEGADLGTIQKLKYKLRRKEAKAQKKESLRAARDAEDAAAEANSEEHRAMLRERLGDTVEERADKLKGRKARRELAKKKRAEAAVVHKEHKRHRAVARLGGRAAIEAESDTKAAAAAASIEGRFKDRLLNDPRFHIDPSSEKVRGKKPATDLAAAVAAARRVSQKPSGAAAAKSSSSAAAPKSDDVNFFLQRPSAGKKRA